MDTGAPLRTVAPMDDAISAMQGKIRALLDALEAADAERGLLLRATDLLLLCWERDYDEQGLRNAAACVDLAIAAAGDHAATAGHLRRAVEYLRRGAGEDDVTRGE